MRTSKIRRHSGRYTPGIAIDAKYEDLIAEALTPDEQYDELKNYRHGVRHPTDRTLLRSEFATVSKIEVEKFNSKIKDEIQVRKARQNSTRIFESADS